jgi:hypothetical protein
MRTRITASLFLVFILALTAHIALAQKDEVAPKYDVTKEVTIKGTIEDVNEMTMPKGEVGVHLMVKTADSVIEVRLCPSGVLKDFEIQFEKGQTVTVTGSKVKIGETDVILAREVVRGNNTITLRDKQGGPVWTWMKK